MLNEFKQFALRGNVIDMAVGIIVGGAFGKIVSSLVVDVVLPPLGLLLGGINFSALSLTLREAVGGKPALVFAYGNFIQATIDFLIIATAVFFAIKVLNRLKRKEEAKPLNQQAAPSPDVVLLTEIRDLLRSKQ